MKILLRGNEYATHDKFVIEQMLTHGGVEVKEPAKTFANKPQVEQAVRKQEPKKPIVNTTPSNKK